VSEKCREAGSIDGLGALVCMAGAAHTLEELVAVSSASSDKTCREWVGDLTDPRLVDQKEPGDLWSHR
jgi:hypothetical protein